jgi:hypothetical protein
MGQEITAYYIEFCSLWFFLTVLSLRLIFFLYKKKLYWWDLFLIIPLFWSFFEVLRRLNLFKVESGTNLAMLFKVGFYSSWISIGFYLLAISFS